MRTKLESPALLIGLATAGVVAGLLLDPRHGARRRREWGDALGSAVGGAYDGLAGGVGALGGGLGDAAGKAASSVGLGRSRTEAWGQSWGAGSWGGRLKDMMGDAWDSASGTAASVGKGVASAGSGAGGAASSLASSVAGLLGSVPAWVGASALFRRKGRLERLRDALSDALSERSDRAGSTLSRRVAKTRWADVEDEVDHGDEHDRTRALPVISSGAALVLLGSAAYLLALSPGAEDRRRRWGETARRRITDLGEFARAAGRQFGGPKRGRRARPGETFLEQTSKVGTPIDHPAETLRRLEDALARVTSDRSEVHLVIREGVVVLQGTASPEEYDKVIRTVQGVTESFVNELQAVSPA